MNEANKETTADKAQVAQNQLSCGEKTINQVREEYGLDQIETAGTRSMYTKRGGLNGNN